MLLLESLSNKKLIFFQDKKLKTYVKMYNENWDLISAEFIDRSDVQCQQRWCKVVNPELVKGPWTKEVNCTYFFGTKFLIAPEKIRPKVVTTLFC